MAASASADDIDYGDAHLMALVEMFPNLSLRQIKMHRSLFPAETSFEFLVDTLIDVRPDGGTPPEEEEAAEEGFEGVVQEDFQIDGLEPFIEACKPCVRAAHVNPARAKPKRQPGRLMRPRLITYKPEVSYHPRSWKKVYNVPKTPSRNHEDLKGLEHLGTPVPQRVHVDELAVPEKPGSPEAPLGESNFHTPDLTTSEEEEEFVDVEGLSLAELEDSIEELQVPVKKPPQVVTLSDSSASPGTPPPARGPAAEDMHLFMADVFPEVPLEELAAFCNDYPGHSLEQLVAEFLLLQEAKEAAELPDSSLKVGGIENPALDDEVLEGGEVEDINVFDDSAVAAELAVDEIPDEPEDLEMIERYQDLLTMFPTADPDFLRERATSLTAETMQRFVALTLETGEYPKEDEYRARERVRRLKDKYVDRFDAIAFLGTFPDPAGHFDSRKAVVSADRTEKAVAYLALRYSSWTVDDLAALLERNGGNLSRSCAEAGAGKATTGWLDVFADCEDMLQEIAFIEHREEIELLRRYLTATKQVEVIAAQCKKETLTCGCCFGDTFLLNDMAACGDGHLFCKECIAGSAEVLIGLGKSEFPCLEDCGKLFSVKTLKSVLKRSVFLRMEQRRQFEEVQAAEIPDLETCPACDFSAIPRPDDIVFTCLNPDCQLVTCRKCREPSHIPLRCEELPEKEQHTRIRTELEDRMTQALLRECWQCKKKFVKSDGCNKMQCTCGALMCYLCRQPVKDYSHFNGPGGSAFHKCELFSNNEKLHVDAVRDAAVKARAEVAAANPNLELKYDPTLLLP